jgi:hypothetical protein
MFKNHRFFFLIAFMCIISFFVTVFFNSFAIYHNSHTIEPDNPFFPPIHLGESSIYSLATGDVKELIAQPLALIVLLSVIFTIFMYKGLITNAASYIEGIILVILLSIGLITLIMLPNDMKDPKSIIILAYLFPLYYFQIILLSVSIIFACLGTILSYLYGHTYQSKYRLDHVYKLKQELHDWKI